MARNYIDLADEGVRRMLRATRKGIEKEELREYALLPRADGSPVGHFHNSFDAIAPGGFRRSEFIL